MVRRTPARFLWSLAIAFALTFAVAAIASAPNCSTVGILLAPGVFGAALIFSQGIHSDAPRVYLILAAIMNAVLWAWPIFWFLGWRSSRRGFK
jgi:hypothetical protein